MAEKLVGTCLGERLRREIAETRRGATNVSTFDEPSEGRLVLQP